MWREWESLLGLWTSSHLWGQLPHSGLFLFPDKACPSTLLEAFDSDCKQQKPAGMCKNRCWSLQGQPVCRERASPKQRWDIPLGGASLPSVIAGSCFFSCSRCLERFVTMLYASNLVLADFLDQLKELGEISNNIKQRMEKVISRLYDQVRKW